jgi:methylmalonyl-CoA mutase
MDDLTLAAEFPPATREQWLKLVETVLKGADFDKKLVSRTYDGLRIEPLYPKAEAMPSVMCAGHGPWRIAQRVDHPEPKTANELALADLEGGANALAFVYAGAPSARGFGVEAQTVEDLDRALQGVMLDWVTIRLETAPFQGRAAAAQWAALIERRSLDPAALIIDFGLDPIGDMARTGGSPVSWPAMGEHLAGTVRGLRDAGFGSPAIRVDTRPYHEAGAGEAQELAAALATGVTYLRALEGGGDALDRIRGALAFLVVADADEFLTVAKLRALRRLWARVEEACGLAPKPVNLQAETAWRMTTRRDPWVNLLRTTVATFSAGLGGADAITVLPFTAALGLPDAFARRMARNTQLILLEESNLARVADPAAGAGGFEALTEGLCQKAWALFQEIEREGGIVESLSRGDLQARIAAVRTERERAVATRRDPITGTSEFPDIREAAVSVLIPAPNASPRDAGRGETAFPADLVAQAGQGASLGERAASASSAGPVTAAPLPSIRAAEPFERLRDRSDAVLAETGARPKVFLANLGPIAAFTARTTFAKNFFEAGGFETWGNETPAAPADIVQAGLDWLGGAAEQRVCLCSSDEVYAREAAETAGLFRDAGVDRVCLAGRPGELEAALRAAGADTFAFAGCDALAVLASFYEGNG